MQRRRSAGFTILELLIVVAIIGILAGMLLPALGSARDSARSVNCIANLKQLVIGWQIYADSHDGMACPSYVFTDGFSMEHGWDFKFKPADPSDWEYGFLGSYIRDGRINACPSYSPRTTWGRPYTGYAYNATYIGGDMGKTPSAKLSRIKDPSNTVVFADAGYSNPVLPNNYLRAPSESHDLFVSGLVHFRHRGAANVAYVDGHVAAVREKFHYNAATPEVGALSEDDSAYDLE